MTRGINPKPLSSQHHAFIDAFLADPKRVASEAYTRATGTVGKSAHAGAHRWMRDPRIKSTLEMREKELRERAALTAQEVLEHIAEVVKADPRDLIEYRRGACRYCHGVGFQYQRTPQEMRDALKLHRKENPKDEHGLQFDQQGGVGFNPNKPAHAECPECFGRGEGYSYAKDLRDVPRGAARLFATIEETREGIKIRVRNQDKNLELAAKTLGLLKTVQEDPDHATPAPSMVTFNRRDASQ